MVEKYFDDFDKFWELINSNINFSFVRYADGEIMLINGTPVGTNTQAFEKDKWYSNGGVSKLGSDLDKCLSLDYSNFYFAISSVTDNISDYLFLINKIKNKDNVTFANLWINANYNKTISNIKNLKRDVVLICNEACKLENIPFEVVDFLPFPNDCVNFWENNSDDFTNKLVNLSNKHNNTLFIVCCGPTSAVLIQKMFTTNQNNTYIDFGSSLDIFIHNKETRPYMDSKSVYNKMISKF
jgi:hypothetical protein